MIDAHAHLNATYTVDALTPVLETFKKNNGSAIIDVTTTLEDIPVSQTLIKSFPADIWTSVGIHPEETSLEQPDSTLESFSQLKSLFESLHNVVAIGETGLDYLHAQKTNNPERSKEIQQALFIEHLRFAKDKNFPLVIHARGVTPEDITPYKQILGILAQESFTNAVYFHSYAGNEAVAEEIVSCGGYLGCNGIATYSGAKQVAGVITKMPLSSFILETDAPFLIPSNADRELLQDHSINEPVMILYTAKRIASLKNIDVTEVLKQTEQNTRHLFERIS